MCDKATLTHQCSLPVGGKFRPSKRPTTWDLLSSLKDFEGDLRHVKNLAGRQINRQLIETG